MIAKDDVGRKITDFVGQHPGCTAIEMVVGVGFGEDFALDIPVELETLINEGSLIEVEYVLARMEYRTKSLLFPKGTSIVIAREPDGINVSGKVLPPGTKISVRKN
jgi:hypothetical protein